MGAKSSTIVGGAFGGAISTAFVAQAAASAGVQVIAGSIFGTIVQAQTILGCSTAAESVVLGMTSATMAGVVVIAASIGVGALIGYYVYTRLRRSQNPIIDQAISREQVNPSVILNNPQHPDLPEFTRISMTEAQFNNILSLTESGFAQCASNSNCEHTFQVMRQPYRMRCCQRLNKVGERVYIQAELQRSNRCLLCRSQARRQDMIFDQIKYNEILGFRMRLVKVYKQANDQQKRKWQNLIDNQFGFGYTQKHLKNFSFSN